MNRILFFLLVSSLLLTAAACSTKKTPEQSAIQGNKVISTLQDMSLTYEKKDLAAFMAQIDNSYKERQAFVKSLESIFAKYETVRFTIQYTKMLITVEYKDMTKAAFNWDSEWQTAGGSVQKNSGRSTFVFDPRETKLVSIDGKNPFIPQPAETPGKQ
ncbi:MAG: hypothetical protein ACM30F_05435 [Nitrospirota bacterium]|nr:hypothetical protein [Nitrospirota bacterium]